MKNILKIVGVLHLFYYAVMICYAGFRTTFAVFWMIMGSFWLCLSCFPNKILNSLKWPLCIIAGIFFGHEAVFIRYGTKKAEKGADYVIVLGAHVKGTQPSKALFRRIQKAAEYLEENPEAKVIASGGQGPGEEITEALCIRNVLTDMGITEERILMEDASTTTWENLAYSSALVGKDKHFVIVTNGFHMFRSLQTARMQGIKAVQGLAASEDRILMINYYVREFFAWMAYRGRSE